MFNPVTWFRNIMARRPKATETVDLMATWRKHVWDWHVPLQLQAIAACAPFNAACDQQRANIQSGLPLDKKRLQQEFTALIKAMVVFNQFIKEEFFKWYVSAQGAEWRSMLEELGMAKEYLAIAKQLLEEATETTILACQQHAKDVINANELYETYPIEQTVAESTLL
jgi:hypothetical protein